MTQRQKDNYEIVSELLTAIEQHPDLRFSQVLFLLEILQMKDGNIVDIFYEEPTATLQRIRKRRNT